MKTDEGEMEEYICDTCDLRYMVSKQVVAFIKCKSCYTKEDNIQKEKVFQNSSRNVRITAVKTEPRTLRGSNLQLDGDEKKFKCINCPQTFTRRDSKTKHENNKTCFRGPQYILKSEDEIPLKSDQGENSLLRTNVQKEKESSEQKGIINCDHCLMASSGIDNFLVHLKKCHPDLYPDLDNDISAINQHLVSIEPLNPIEPDILLDEEETMNSEIAADDPLQKD